MEGYMKFCKQKRGEIAEDRKWWSEKYEHHKGEAAVVGTGERREA